MTQIPPAAENRRNFVLAGAIVALVATITDQASKLWLLTGYDLGTNGPIELTPFLELILVWNRGISYGLFSQHSELGRWVLVALTGGAIVALGIWLLRAQRPSIALPVGLILGGAMGNLIDRISQGAVIDFVHFHVGRFSWYVFNLADVWIVAGVLILLYDSLHRR